jgi:ATP-dependent helicase/nuclease subunit A
MHKAKGLEFDTVILPGLSRQTRSSDKPLLLFDQFTRADESAGLVVAPIVSSESAGDPIYDLLWQFESERDRYEQDRLLYVAVTRARRRLHLFAQITLDAEDPGVLRPPPSNTLLARLWPAISSQIDATVISRPDDDGQVTQWREAPLRRLPVDWLMPLPRDAVGTTDVVRSSDREEDVEFEWASQWAKHVGSVVHRWLQHIAEEGVETWSAQRVTTLEPRLRSALRRAGVARADLDLACERTLTALCNTLADDRGQWMLSGTHENPGNELALTTGDARRFANHVIDRTFVTEDGTRWIIDYKTSTHEGSSTDAFLTSEADRYRAQLRRYRDAFATLEHRTIRTALYFPLLQQFHEVDCDASE